MGNNHTYQKGSVLIRESVPADIVELKDRLRQEEINEVWASHNSTAEQSLVNSYLLSSKCFTFLVDGVPAAMFGIAPDTLLGEKACVWFLGSDLMAKAKKTFMIQSKRFIDLLLDDYPCLYNYVDFRYKKSLEWLKWCGAKVFDPQPFGLEHLPFCRIELRRA